LRKHAAQWRFCACRLDSDLIWFIDSSPPYPNLMASQKLTNCCVAAIALVTAAYLSTPLSSTIARLAFGAFCLAIPFWLSCESIKFGLPLAWFLRLRRSTTTTSPD
jgi:hypothetical protein